MTRVAWFNWETKLINFILIPSPLGKCHIHEEKEDMVAYVIENFNFKAYLRLSICKGGRMLILGSL